MSRQRGIWSAGLGVAAVLAAIELTLPFSVLAGFLVAAAAIGLAFIALVRWTG